MNIFTSKMHTVITRLHIISSLACLGLAGVAHAQSVSLDFETTGQLSGNFRAISTLPGTADQTSNNAANDYILHDKTAAYTWGVAYLYDTTPLDATTGTDSTFASSKLLTAGFDFYLASTSSSIAVIFADASNLSNNLMALVNIDASGTTDQIRFFKDGAATSTDLSAGTLVGSAINQSIGINAGTTFTSGNGYSATLSSVSDTPTITLSVGTLSGVNSVSQTYSAGDLDWANTVVLFRMYDANAAGGNGVALDNFFITAIPEPASVATFGGLAALLVIGISRRQPR